MSRGNIKVPEEDYERHNERRKEMGVTWAEYVDSQAPELNVRLDETEIREVVRDELQRFKEDLLSELRR